MQTVNCNTVGSFYPQLFRSFYHKLSLYTEKKSKYLLKQMTKKRKIVFTIYKVIECYKKQILYGKAGEQH